MFVENYRLKSNSIMAGVNTRPIPFPRISAGDWRVWQLVLPFHAENLDRTTVAPALLLLDQGVPSAQRGNQKGN